MKYSEEALGRNLKNERERKIKGEQGREKEEITEDAGRKKRR